MFVLGHLLNAQILKNSKKLAKLIQISSTPLLCMSLRKVRAMCSIHGMSRVVILPEYKILDLFPFSYDKMVVILIIKMFKKLQ